MKSIFLGFVFMFGVCVDASQTGLESEYWVKIKLARSESKLLEETAQFDQLRVLLRACHIQLDENLIPAACYSASNLAQQLGVENKIEIHRDDLDRQCLNIAAKTNEVEVKNLKFIPVICKKVATKRLRINKYKSRYDF